MQRSSGFAPRIPTVWRARPAPGMLRAVHRNAGSRTPHRFFRRPRSGRQRPCSQPGSLRFSRILASFGTIFPRPCRPRTDRTGWFRGNFGDMGTHLVTAGVDILVRAGILRARWPGPGSGLPVSPARPAGGENTEPAWGKPREPGPEESLGRPPAAPSGGELGPWTPSFSPTWARRPCWRVGGSVRWLSGWVVLRWCCCAAGVVLMR